ncbi:copper resistance CopC/CopD family protein [Cohnella massiliensis]|uniref:copper resistance CopC/CopD family protein n=1 Tax=Cohnella massiliensis TaxID=1816691 RepID=UPI0009BB042B|nr:copper resistance protein CopC [Cohnella massiliensis]
MSTASAYGRKHAAALPALRRFVAFIVFLAGAIGLSAPSAFAHATLEQASPAQDAKLASAPEAVELLFNERLDGTGYSLRVLDDASKSVTDAEPERFEQGRGLRLSLPKLEEGHYTVSYSVISADGHPVSGAYVFTVGNPPAATTSDRLDPHAQVGHDGHGEHMLGDRAFVLYATRIAYYAGLLLTAGLALWSLSRGASPVVRERREAALGFMGKFALCATLAYVVLHVSELAQGEPMSEWGRILIQTTIGRLYLAELLLAIAATLLRSLGAYARLFWAAAALFAEAWSGHAAAFSPIGYSVGLDFVHLLGAALWGGGLALLILVWSKERTEAGRFALLFSKWALLSFVALWITGTLSVLKYLPTLSYLLYTSWGKWLIAKTALSALVVIAAFLIRLRLRKGNLPGGGLLKLDIGLFGAIVLCVGILTYQNPLPSNAPLHYHEMGEEMHLTLRIAPNAPGENAFTLKIWLPEELGLPKQALLRLMPEGRDDVGAIDVPLEAYEDEELDDFAGYEKATYRAQGSYLPFAGKWKAQVRVTDSESNELVRETEFRIY